MSDMFLLMFSVVLAENYVFLKLFKIRPFQKLSKKPLTLIALGAFVGCAMTVSNTVAYLIDRCVPLTIGATFLRPLAFVLSIAAVAVLAAVIMRRFAPRLYAEIKDDALIALTNCAVLGATQSVTYQGVSGVLCAFAAALGFVLAVAVFECVREKLRYCEPPAAFRGIGIALIAACLVLMAFSGFSDISFA